MARTVGDLMTQKPRTLPESSTALDAARAMRENNVGSIVVVDEGGRLRGIVTDRDITIRVVAEARDPGSTPLTEFASEDLKFVSPESNVDQAVDLMRQDAIRRLPVVQGGKPVGIISLGDLAVELDRKSALADISDAPPNR
jgi:CBS domain-containing protein